MPRLDPAAVALSALTALLVVYPSAGCSSKVVAETHGAVVDAGAPDGCLFHPDAGRGGALTGSGGTASHVDAGPPFGAGGAFLGGLLGGSVPPTGDASVTAWCQADGGDTTSPFRVVHPSVARYCEQFECPYVTLAAYLDAHDCAVADSGAPITGEARFTGCGTDTVGGISPFGGSELAYDSVSGALVGAMIGSDTPIGPCRIAQYLAGVSTEPCASAVRYSCVPKR